MPFHNWQVNISHFYTMFTQAIKHTLFCLTLQCFHGAVWGEYNTFAQDSGTSHMYVCFYEGSCTCILKFLWTPKWFRSIRVVLPEFNRGQLRIDSLRSAQTVSCDWLNAASYMSIIYYTRNNHSISKWSCNPSICLYASQATLYFRKVLPISIQLPS